MPNSHGSESDEQGAEPLTGEASGSSPPDGAQRSTQAARASEGGGGRAAATAEQRDLVAELAQMEDRYKRALADLDNYRKRVTRDTERRVADSKEALLRDWIEAVDSVERALRMEHAGPVSEGLRAVLDQMEAILEREGVRRLGAAGDRFDPELHEAVAVRHADGVPDRTIVEVTRSGFALGDRVLRPAQVVVARAQHDDH
jgi:molecular chaperone GrpE